MLEQPAPKLFQFARRFNMHYDKTTSKQHTQAATFLSKLIGSTLYVLNNIFYSQIIPKS